MHKHYLISKVKNKLHFMIFGCLFTGCFQLFSCWCSAEPMNTDLWSILHRNEATQAVVSVLLDVENKTRDLIVKKNQLLESKGNYISSKARSYPMARGTVGGGILKRYRVDQEGVTTKKPLILNAEASYAIDLWGEARAERMLGKMELEKSSAAYAFFANKKKGEMLGEFFDLYLEKLTLTIQTERLRQQEEIFKEQLEEKALGRLTELVVVETEIKTALQENRLSQRLYAYEQREKLFLYNYRMIEKKLQFQGLSVDNLLRLFEQVSKWNTMQSWTGFSLSVQDITSGIDREKLQLQRLLGKRFPQLELVGRYEKDGDLQENVARDNLFFGFRISWNLFDGNRNFGEKMSTQARIRRLKGERELKITQDNYEKRLFKDELYHLEKEIRLISKQWQILHKNYSDLSELFNESRISNKRWQEENFHYQEIYFNIQKKIIDYLRMVIRLDNNYKNYESK